MSDENIKLQSIHPFTSSKSKLSKHCKYNGIGVHSGILTSIAEKGLYFYEMSEYESLCENSNYKPNKLVDNNHFLKISIENEYSWLEYNCDGSLLIAAILLDNNSLSLIKIIDVEKTINNFEETIFCQYKPHTACILNDLKWHPNDKNSFLMVLNDVVNLCTTKQNEVMIINSKPNAFCVSWSPKGKQFSVVMKNETTGRFLLNQYDNLMTEKRSTEIGDVKIECKVPYDLIPVDLCWYSTFNCIIGFRGSNQTHDQFKIFPCNFAIKTSTINVLHDALSSNDCINANPGPIARLHSLHIPDWNSVVLANTSAENAVIYEYDANNLNVVTTYCLPVDGYVVGLGCDFTSTRQFPPNTASAVVNNDLHPMLMLQLSNGHCFGIYMHHNTKKIDRIFGKIKVSHRNQNRVSTATQSKIDNGSERISSPIETAPINKLIGSDGNSVKLNIFGTTQPSVPSTTNFFGTATSSPSKLFGSHKPDETSKNNLFGGLNVEPSKTSLFAAPKSEEPSKTSLFGTIKPEPSKPSLFGAPKSEEPSKPSLFGTPKSEEPSKPSLFGTPKPEEPSKPSLFGTPKPEEPSKPSLFGTPKPEEPSKPSLFGTPKSEEPSKPSLFAAPKPGEPSKTNLTGHPESEEPSKTSVPGVQKSKDPNLEVPSKTGLFVSPKVEESPQSFQFGAHKPEDPPKPNLFGPSKPDSATRTNLFPTAKQNVTPTTQDPPKTGLFTSKNPEHVPATNIFTSTKQGQSNAPTTHKPGSISTPGSWEVPNPPAPVSNQENLAQTSKSNVFLDNVVKPTVLGSESINLSQKVPTVSDKASPVKEELTTKTKSTEERAKNATAPKTSGLDNKLPMATVAMNASNAKPRDHRDKSESSKLVTANISRKLASGDCENSEKLTVDSKPEKPVSRSTPNTVVKSTVVLDNFLPDALKLIRERFHNIKVNTENVISKSKNFFSSDLMTGSVPKMFQEVESHYSNVKTIELLNKNSMDKSKSIFQDIDIGIDFTTRFQVTMVDHKTHNKNQKLTPNPLLKKTSLNLDESMKKVNRHLKELEDALDDIENTRNITSTQSTSKLIENIAKTVESNEFSISIERSKIDLLKEHLKDSNATIRNSSGFTKKILSSQQQPVNRDMEKYMHSILSRRTVGNLSCKSDENKSLVSIDSKKTFKTPARHSSINKKSIESLQNPEPQKSSSLTTKLTNQIAYSSPNKDKKTTIDSLPQTQPVKPGSMNMGNILSKPVISNIFSKSSELSNKTQDYFPRPESTNKAFTIATNSQTVFKTLATEPNKQGNAKDELPPSISTSKSIFNESDSKKEAIQSITSTIPLETTTQTSPFKPGLFTSPISDTKTSSPLTSSDTSNSNIFNTKKHTTSTNQSNSGLFSSFSLASSQNLVLSQSSLNAVANQNVTASITTSRPSNISKTISFNRSSSDSTPANEILPSSATTLPQAGLSNIQISPDKSINVSNNQSVGNLVPSSIISEVKSNSGESSVSPVVSEVVTPHSAAPKSELPETVSNTIAPVSTTVTTTQSGGFIFASSTGSNLPSAASPNKSATVLFGSTAVPVTRSETGIFGSMNTTTTKSSTGLFGSTSTASVQSSGLFGSNISNSTSKIAGIPVSTVTSSQPSSLGLFGSPNSSKPQPSTGLFGSPNTSTNQSSTTSTPSTTGIAGTQPSSGLFGSASVADPKPSSGLFGSPNAQSSGGLFGSTNTTSTQQSADLFGSPITSTKQPSSGLFGSPNTSTIQQSTGLFGSSNTTTTQQSTGLFGSSNTTTTQQSTGLFGSSNTTTTQQSTGLFGSSNTTTTQQSTGLFGSVNTQPISGLFGSANVAPNQSSTGFFGSSNVGNSQQSNGLFGSTNTTTTQQSTGLFGSSNTQPSTGLFGTANTNTTQQSSGLFGSANSTTTQQSSGLFGSANSNTTQQSSGLFGTANTNTTQPSSGLFGSANTQPSTGLFGSANVSNNQPSSGLFGSANTSATQPNTGLFGSTKPTGNQTGTGLFGSSATQNQQSGLFGSSANKPNGGLFNNLTTPNASGGLFGTTAPNNQFGSSSTQPATTDSSSGSLFGSSFMSGLGNSAPAANTSNIFAAVSSNTPNAGSTNLFASSSQSNNSGGLFSSNQSTGFNFGSKAPAPAQQQSTLFGSRPTFGHVNGALGQNNSIQTGTLFTNSVFGNSNDSQMTFGEMATGNNNQSGFGMNPSAPVNPGNIFQSATSPSFTQRRM